MEIAETRRYDQIARLFHWVMAALILFALISGLSMVRLDHGPDQDRLFDMHRSFGATILALVLLRLVWRLTHPAPPLPATIRTAERFAADVTHWLLYGLMLAQPLIGWLGGSAFDDTMPIYGLFNLPHIIAKDEPVAEILMAAHRFVGYVIIAVLALHIAAAAYHAARVDGIMSRMWW
jgi:cytochrome b561